MSAPKTHIVLDRETGTLLYGPAGPASCAGYVRDNAWTPDEMIVDTVEDSRLLDEWEDERRMMQRPNEVAAEVLSAPYPFSKLMALLSMDEEGISCVIHSLDERDRTNGTSITPSEHAYVAGILPDMASRFAGYLMALRALTVEELDS